MTGGGRLQPAPASRAAGRPGRSRHSTAARTLFGGCSVCRCGCQCRDRILDVIGHRASNAPRNTGYPSGLGRFVNLGVAPSEVRDEMNTNAARRDELKARLAAADHTPPLLHPEMATIYRTKVTELAKALQDPGQPVGGHRGLARPRGRDCAHARPGAGETLQIELKGNLAAMLGATVQTKRSPETGDLFLPIQLVAGAGFEPATFGL